MDVSYTETLVWLTWSSGHIFWSAGRWRCPWSAPGSGSGWGWRSLKDIRLQRDRVVGQSVVRYITPGGDEKVTSTNLHLIRLYHQQPLHVHTDQHNMNTLMRSCQRVSSVKHGDLQSSRSCWSPAESIEIPGKQVEDLAGFHGDVTAHWWRGGNKYLLVKQRPEHRQWDV